MRQRKSSTKKTTMDPNPLWDRLSGTPQRDLKMYENERKERELDQCTFAPNASRQSLSPNSSHIHERLYAGKERVAEPVIR